MTEQARPYIHLVDGRRIVLPIPPALAEFALPGNSRQFGEFLAFYDGTSQTGALFYFESQVWHLQHPMPREVFWTNCELLDGLAPSREVVAAMAAAAAATGTTH